MKVIILIVMSGIAGIVSAQDEIPRNINYLLNKNICNTCHQLDEKLIGPSYKELASKGNSAKEIAELIKQPQPSNWPDYPPMAAMPYLQDKEVDKIAKWIATLASEADDKR